MRGVQSDTGIFVLGSGTYNSSGAYRIFRKNTDGSVSPVDLRAERSLRIKEDAELKGVGYWRTEFSNFDKNSPLAPFAVGWFYNQAMIRPGTSCSGRDCRPNVHDQLKIRD